MFSSSAWWTFAHVTTLRQDVAGGSVLTRFAYTRIQRLLAVSTGELRRTDASVIRRFELLHLVISMLEAGLVIDVVTFLRVLLRSALIDRGAMSPLASHDVHPVLVLAFPSFLDSSALAAVAPILFEDRLTRCTVLTRQIRARVLPALLHSVSLQDLLVAAHVEIDKVPIDL